MSKAQEDTIQAIFHYIAETGSLMQMKRSHDRILINTFDTVASHAYHVAVIAYCLTRLEGLSHSDGLKALAMGVVHDNPEVRTGDLNFLEKHYANTDEQKAFADQIKNLPFAGELSQLNEEYQARETLVAKCAKDADTIEQMYQQWVLASIGNQEAAKWLAGNKQNRIPKLRTESAKQIALLFYQHTPSDWWTKDVAGEKLDLAMLNGKR